MAVAFWFAVAAAVIAIAVTIGKTIQAEDLRADLAAAQAEIARCRETHLGDLAAMTELTRPADRPPLDAAVRQVGVPFPINRPHNRGSN